MPGDWIKMRVDLQTHPKVVRILSACDADKLRVIGALHAVWSIFDAHSEDGNLDGYTPDALDNLIGFPGFARAMASVEWLDITAKSLRLPRFEDHNGQSAKRRDSETKRKRSVRKMSAPDADKMQTKSALEKRREEEETPQRKSVAVFSDESVEMKAARYLFRKIRENNPGFKEPKFQAWAKDIDRILRLDHRDKDQLRAVIDWCQSDNVPSADGFCWAVNILSPNKLRKQYDQLKVKMEASQKRRAASHREEGLQGVAL